MTHEDAGNYPGKHDPKEKPDPEITSAIMAHSGARQITCADLHKIATELKANPLDVGKTADLMNIKIIKCQLGLFGHSPESRVVEPAETVSPEMGQSIRDQSGEGHLSCEGAWKIAEQLQTEKMDVCNAAEAMKVKIRFCQLGTF